MSYSDQHLAIVKPPKLFLSYVLSLIGLGRPPSPAAVDTQPGSHLSAASSISSSSSAYTTTSHSSTPPSSHYPISDDSLDSEPVASKLLSTTDDDPPMSLPWVQAYTKALVQLDNHLRPTDRFSQTHSITATLQKLVRRCTDHFTDHTALLALLAIAEHCLDTPSPELGQHLFYRAKLGRLLVLEMTSVVKRTPPSKVSLCGDWVVGLERVCAALARLDPTWVHVADYQWLVDHVKAL